MKAGGRGQEAGGELIYYSALSTQHSALFTIKSFRVAKEKHTP
jgi:hypothetical protein